MKNRLVKIYSVHDKSPEFIRLQYYTFEKFLLDKYEFIVCDNAATDDNSKIIHSVCAALGIKVLSVPNRMHQNANIACSYPLDWLMQEYLNNEREADFSIFIDSDMFLIEPLSFIHYLGNYQIGAVFQSRGYFTFNDQRNHIYYFWNALVIFNHKNIRHIKEITWACSGSKDSPYFPRYAYGRNMKLYPTESLIARFFRNFTFIVIPFLLKILGFVERSLPKFMSSFRGEFVDVGGPTYFYIHKYHPDVKWISLERVSVEHGNLEIIPSHLRKIYQSFYNYLYASDFLCDRKIFHYRAGSNWNGMSPYLQAKKKYFAKKLLEHYIGPSFEESVCHNITV